MKLYYWFGIFLVLPWHNLVRSPGCDKRSGTKSRLTKLILTPLTNQEWNQLIKNAQQLYEKCAPGQAMSKCFRYNFCNILYIITILKSVLTLRYWTWTLSGKSTHWCWIEEKEAAWRRKQGDHVQLDQNMSQECWGLGPKSRRRKPWFVEFARDWFAAWMDRGAPTWVGLSKIKTKVQPYWGISRQLPPSGRCGRTMDQTISWWGFCEGERKGQIVDKGKEDDGKCGP